MLNVLHIVESLNKGAVENWLVRMLKFSTEQTNQVKWTFFCVENVKGRLDDVVIASGGKIIYSKIPLRNKIKFLYNLRRIIVKEKIDIIHSHHDYLSGYYFIATIFLPVKRIVHIHNSDKVIPTKKTWLIPPITKLLRTISLMYADKIVGISKHTLSDFYNGYKMWLIKGHVHYYGFNFETYFSQKRDQLFLLENYGVPLNKKIVLFLSRIDKAKNPIFALNVIKAMNEIDESVMALFVGQGSLVDDLKKEADRLEMNEDQFKYLGWSDNVPQIMANSDLFILPHNEHPMEGLGLVLLESQSTGLPLLISKGISDDVILPSSMYKRLSLKDDIKLWAKEGLNLLNKKKVPIEERVKSFKESPFEMNYSLNHLMGLYNNLN